MNRIEGYDLARALAILGMVAAADARRGTSTPRPAPDGTLGQQPESLFSLG